MTELTPYQRRYWADPEHYRALARARMERYHAKHAKPIITKSQSEKQRRYRMRKAFEELMK